ncbi:small multi-drug export protein [Cytobacillus gottheilii]|uniref:small multi-drug export protein n=1 Tax=Cytobacillus gottheilii TaxID=859144 RepID=UPI0008331F67|nr:small multi-drug export protein [Cytobacillus gottheilii]
MNLFVAYLVIFLLGATPFMEVVGVIPLGIAVGLPAIPVTILAFAGNILTIWLLILLIDHVKVWLQRRKEKKGKEGSDKKGQRAARIWKKYGLPGLTIVSPILIGTHLGVILAMSFGGTRKQITIWMTGSIIVWTIVMSIASFYGIDYFYEKTGNEGFLKDFLENTD